MAEAGFVEHVAKGVAAGLVASFVMDQFQKLLAKDAPDSGEEDEPATVKAADRVHRALTGKPIAKHLRPAAGNVFHYGLGAVLGGIYAGAARPAPAVTAVAGSAFASVVWLVLDEGLLPALGLGKKWMEVPASTHLHGWVSHLAFGSALEAARRRLVGRNRGVGVVQAGVR